MASALQFVFPSTALALMMSAGPAAAQQQAEPAHEPLDAAVEDRGPLSVSLRDHFVDLRQPTGFEFVYHVGEHDDLLMRISGGVHAVFPRSIYGDTAYGPTPEIPPGTVYFLSEPTDEELKRMGLGPVGVTSLPADRSGLRVARRIEAAPLDEEDPVAADDPSPPRRNVFAVPQRTMPPFVEHDREFAATTGPGGRIISDPDYRLNRLRDLLRRAAEAGVERGG